MGKKETQETLDGLQVEKLAPLVFMCGNVLHAVTQFVAVDDQVRGNNTNDT
jgi:hypothetical protein